jgi:hypothetical protein
MNGNRDRKIGQSSEGKLLDVSNNTFIFPAKAAFASESKMFDA